MKMRSLSLSVACFFLSTLPSAAQSVCKSTEKNLFFCETKNRKSILLCDDGKSIKYYFDGKHVVTKERKLVTTTQWDGVGRSISYSIELENSGYVYSIYFSADRMSPKHDINAGVRVIQNDRDIANIQCVISRKMINNMEGVDLQPTAR